MDTDKKGIRRELVLAVEAGPAAAELAGPHLWEHRRGSAVVGKEPYSCLRDFSFLMAGVRFWLSRLSCL